MKKTARPLATFDSCPITSLLLVPSLSWRMAKAMKPIAMAAFLSTLVASPSTAVLAVVDQVNFILNLAYPYRFIPGARYSAGGGGGYAGGGGSPDEGFSGGGGSFINENLASEETEAVNNFGRGSVIFELL